MNYCNVVKEVMQFSLVGKVKEIHRDNSYFNMDRSLAVPLCVCVKHAFKHEKI